MKKVVFVVLFVIFSCHASGQAEAKEYIAIEQESISVEIGKTGLVFNLVYDHLFEGNEFGVRAMAGTNFGGLVRLHAIGVGGYYIRGSYRQFLEMGTDMQYFSTKRFPEKEGFATTTVYPDYTTKTFYASANIGYRVYKMRFLYRFGLTAGVTKNDFIPGAYASFGYTF